MPKRSGVSVSGYAHVLRSVGIKATRSMPTAMTTENVGSRVNSHGSMPKRAIHRKTVSVLVIPLNPYLSEKRKMMSVKTSDAPVGRAPIPAPLATCPKNTIPDTNVHTSQVYGCGLTLPLKISRRYGTLPATANSAAIIARVSFTQSVYLCEYLRHLHNLF